MLHTAKHDLEIAERAIEDMKQEKNFLIFEERWQIFLMRVEHLWEFVEEIQVSPLINGLGK